MARPKPTATTKRDNSPPPRIEVLTQPKGAAFPAGRMLISSPQEITQVIRTVPRGHTLTLSELRQRLASMHQADYACPLTTGIFIRIAAEAAEEELALNATQPITPWWRIVKDNGRMLDKMPNQPDYQISKLMEEGHSFTQRRGISYLVKNT